MNQEINRILDNQERLREVAQPPFDEADPEHSGEIDRKELMNVVRKAIEAVNEDPSLPLDEVLSDLGLDQEGRISFPDYVLHVQESLRKLIKEPPVSEPEPVFIVPEEAPIEDESVKAERLKNVHRFEQYVDTTGLAKVFEIIFAEIMTKKIEQTNVFGYTAMRLRQIGKEIAHLLPADFAPAQQKTESPAP